MKIEYTLTPEIMKLGAAIAYRKRVLKKMLLIYGALYILMVYSRFGSDKYVTPLFLLVVFALLLLFNRSLYLKRCSTALFKGKSEALQHSILVTDSGLDFTTPTATSQIQWGHFVSYTNAKTGVLVYSQKNIFLFIPSESVVTDGSWEEFTQLLETNIPKKS